MRINVFYEESLIVQNLLQKGFDPMSFPSNFAPGRRIWNCKRCSARVWAKPRAFLGHIEPETWWWCRVCKIEHEREKPDESDELQRQYADKQRIIGSLSTRDTSASQNKNARKRKRHEVQSNTLNSWCKNFDPIVQRKS